MSWAAVAQVAGEIGKLAIDQRNVRDAQLWQQYMSGSAHQREVADLKAAGLNPILSAGGQGASSGSVSPIPASNFGEGITRANSAKAANDLTRAQTALAIKQADNVDAQTDKTRSDTQLNVISGEKMLSDMSATRAQIPGWRMVPDVSASQIAKNTADIAQTRETTKIRAAEAAKEQVVKQLYLKLGPVLDQVLKNILPETENSARGATGVIDMFRRILTGDISEPDPDNPGKPQPRRAQKSKFPYYQR